MISKTYIVRCDGTTCMAEGEQCCTRKDALATARRNGITPVYDSGNGYTLHLCTECRAKQKTVRKAP